MLNPSLVSQYLERISGTVLEKYHNLIRDYVRRRHGIYALYRGDRLYYVGLASNLRNRLRDHLRDKHKGRWDRFSVYLTIGDTHIKELESLVLRIVRPKGNSQSGKLKRAQNLKRALARDIVAYYRHELDDVLDRKRMVEENSKSRADWKTRRPLAGLFAKRLKLRGLYKGKRYRASLLLNGEISVGGRRYETPSEAAKAALGRPKQGWSFWRYERAPGDWVRLRELKRR